MTIPKLTNCETEILHLLTEEFLTQKQIAQRRNCTRQAVNKIVRSLKKKGAYNLGLQKVDKTKGTSQPINQIRIHAQQFIIKIIWKDYKYKNLLKKTSQLDIDGNTVNLWPNSVEIYSNQSFFGEDLTQAMAKSCKYWDRIIARLEHDTNCILKKPRCQNIRLARIHIAETDNEVAKDIENKGDRFFKIYGNDDGKLWFLIDNSFNLHEAEAVHSKRGVEDMRKVTNVFNDIRDKDSYLPSDTKEMIDKMVIGSSNLLKAQENMDCLLYKTNESINWLADNIKSHGPAWFGMRDEMKKFRELAEKQSQKKLGEWF